MSYVDDIINKKPEEFKHKIVSAIQDKIAGYIDWRKNKMTKELFKK